MNANEIRKLDFWQKSFSEIVQREAAAQLAEIHELLLELKLKLLLMAEEKQGGPPQPYVPHPDDKRHAKRGR
jgi:hypothetical protein